MAYNFPDYETWIQSLAEQLRGEDDFNIAALRRQAGDRYAAERDAYDAQFFAQLAAAAPADTTPAAALGIVPGFNAPLTAQKTEEEIIRGQPLSPAQYASAEQYGGYAGDPEYQQYIDANVVIGPDGKRYLPMTNYADLVNRSELRSAKIGTAPAMMATMMAGGALAGATGAGTAASSAFPAAWEGGALVGGTSAGGALGGGVGLEALVGSAGTDALAGASTLSDFALAPAGSGVGGVGSASTTLGTGGTGLGLATGGATNALLTPELVAALGGTGALAGLSPAQVAAANAAMTSGSTIQQIVQGLQNLPPVPPAPPGVGDAGAMDQAGSTGTGIPGSGPATSNAAGGLAGTLQGVGAGVSGASALSRLLDGTATAADYLSILGTAGQAALGIGAGLQQSNATSNLGDRILNMGAPSLARYEASFAPGFDLFGQDGAYKNALDSSWDSALRKLSATGGNPFGNAGGLIEANKAITGSLGLPALQNYRETNRAAGFGNVPQYAQLSSNAIGQQGGAWEAAGAGLESLLRPRQNYTLNLGQFLG